MLASWAPRLTESIHLPLLLGWAFPGAVARVLGRRLLTNLYLGGSGFRLQEVNE